MVTNWGIMLFIGVKNQRYLVVGFRGISNGITCTWHTGNLGEFAYIHIGLHVMFIFNITYKYRLLTCHLCNANLIWINTNL